MFWTSSFLDLDPYSETHPKNASGIIIVLKTTSTFEKGLSYDPMDKENQLLVTDEPVEFET